METTLKQLIAILKDSYFSEEQKLNFSKIEDQFIEKEREQIIQIFNDGGDNIQYFFMAGYVPDMSGDEYYEKFFE